MGIWWLIGISVAVVLGAILVFRVHAFLTLLLAALVVAVLTGTSALEKYAQTRAEKLGLPPQAASQYAAEFLDQNAATRVTKAFGETAGKIGILIALASIIGQCLMESRAATTIVDRMLQLTGPKFAPEAMAASSFLIAIPVFFDTVFYLMVPLARSLRERLGKDYVLFILSILAGGSIAHSLVPPTPGPLFVAGELGVSVGTMLVAGLLIGGCSSVASLAVARVINRLVDVPLRLATDESTSNGMPENSKSRAPSDDFSSAIAKPGLIESLLPIIVPVIMISVASIVSVLVDSKTIGASILTNAIAMIGDKNIAIAVGVLFALTLTRYLPMDRRRTVIGRALSSAGNIILITAAGGAFGAMLRQAGIADVVTEIGAGVPGLMLLPVAFGVTAGIRTLQGSATVAMITAAGVLQGFAYAESLPFHPVYLALAIGAGSKPISWMTDSAFWIITRMTGMTDAEGLKVISTMSIAMGISALIFTLLFAWLIPGV